MYLNRYPTSRISIIAGYGGMGKSFLSTYIATQIVLEYGKKVAIINTEEDKEYIKNNFFDVANTIEQLGLVKGNIDIIEQIENNVMIFDFTDATKFDLDFFDTQKRKVRWKALENLRTILEHADVVFMDPLQSFFTVEEHNNKDIRKIFNAIQSVLSEFEDRTLIAIMHFNKESLNTAIKSTDIERKEMNKEEFKKIEYNGLGKLEKMELLDEMRKAIRGGSEFYNAARYVEIHRREY